MSDRVAGSPAASGAATSINCLFTFFKEKMGLIQVQDFMIYNNDSDVKVKLIG